MPPPAPGSRPTTSEMSAGAGVLPGRGVRPGRAAAHALEAPRWADPAGGGDSPSREPKPAVVHDRLAPRVSRKEDRRDAAHGDYEPSDEGEPGSQGAGRDDRGARPPERGRQPEHRPWQRESPGG